ncbi:unnamed protein product, partial [Tilletia controversa]
DIDENGEVQGLF